MNTTPRLLSALLSFVAVFATAGASPPPVAPAATAYLIAFVEASDCDFYRNGARYDGARAGSHLRDKYALMVAAGHALTTDAFIDRVASSSSMTGRPYEVSCAGHERVPLGPWLREIWARYTNGTPR